MCRRKQAHHHHHGVGISLPLLNATDRLSQVSINAEGEGNEYMDVNTIKSVVDRVVREWERSHGYNSHIIEPIGGNGTEGYTITNRNNNNRIHIIRDIGNYVMVLTEDADKVRRCGLFEGAKELYVALTVLA